MGRMQLVSKSTFNKLFRIPTYNALSTVSLCNLSLVSSAVPDHECVPTLHKHSYVADEFFSPKVNNTHTL